MTVSRKPYMSKGSYQDMMRTSIDYQSKDFKHSEMKKPYLDNGDFQEMEATTDALPGMRPPWLDPDDWHMSDAPITDIGRGEDQHVFLCSADGCYCPGETTCINFSCMALVPIRLSGASGEGASGLKGKGGRIDDGAGKGQICVTTPADAKNGVRISVKGTAYDGVQVESKMIIWPCEYRAYNEKCSNCVCGTETIGYTSAQMSTSGTQTLTVVGAVTGCTYNWSITGGGGSLDSSTGVSVIYTAPASNADCANNPTITMSCGSTLKGTLKIAVNAVEGNIIATETCMMSLVATSPGWSQVKSWCRYTYCDGRINDSGTHYTICGGEDPFCQNMFATYCNTECAGWGCGRAEPCNIPVDVRTPTQKANGCCPEQLL